MIELAPGHKQGLPVDNPVLLGGGTIGYGEAVPDGLQVGAVGAVVVGPFAAAPRAGSAPPRMATTNGGLVLQTGGQNRGVRAAIRHFARLWPRLGVPVVGQIVEHDSIAAASVAERLARCDGVLGVEVALPSADSGTLSDVVRAVTRAADLPCLVKVPLDRAAEYAEVAVRAGAHALVMGLPPNARLPTMPHGSTETRTVQGALYGPLVFAVMLEALDSVMRQDLGVPLIACGGIHTAAQMREALALGAAAIQVDSGVWIEPALPHWLLAVWQEEDER